MTKELIRPSEFHTLLDIKILDVRAPVEFAAGHIPGSVNIPLLNDQERHLVGIKYKENGQDAAIALGSQLVSGEIKAERMMAWRHFFNENPKAVITCFRGGLRSQTVQSWLVEVGVTRPRVEGGYKALRQWLSDVFLDFNARGNFISVAGLTGSGKTKLLRSLKNFRQVLDLEGAAHHRGSVFGTTLLAQPSQPEFENLLGLTVLRENLGVALNSVTLIEDESRTIGKCVLPPPFFEKLQAAPVVIVEEPLDSRVENIFDEYVLQSGLASKNSDDQRLVYESFQNNILKIQKKLGGARAQEIQKDMELAWNDLLNRGDLQTNKIWIKKLLEWYYDPLYLATLARRGNQVLFKGLRTSCFEYLKSENI